MFCGSVSKSGVGVSHGIGSWDWGGEGGPSKFMVWGLANDQRKPANETQRIVLPATLKTLPSRIYSAWDAFGNTS